MTLTAPPTLVRADRPVSVTPEVAELIAADAPVAIGVSGGKDSTAVAFATVDYLDSVGHAGPRVLVHSDLGLVEWEQSLPVCQRLAHRLGLELVVVRRNAGGLMERWEQRWANSVRRYADLECVKVILPWSTKKMRFCTSELKTDVICRGLRTRFPGSHILSVVGVRGEESSDRAKAPVSKCQPKLSSRTHNTAGTDWLPIKDWRLGDVLAYIRSKQFDLHDAYTVYGSSRVSCAFCILASKADLVAAAGCSGNFAAYRRMVDLEIASTFAFKSDGWLGDVAPQLLTGAQLGSLLVAKKIAAVRQEAEALIPKHLLYEKGWPKVIPSADEADLLVAVRTSVAAGLGIEIKYTDRSSLIGRYRELLALRQKRNGGAR